MIWTLFDTASPARFSIDNAKLTLILAETRDEGKAVARLVFTTSKETENLVFSALVPFETLEIPFVSQDSLLDKELNEKIGLSMVFEKKIFDFYNIEGRKLILREKHEKKDTFCSMKGEKPVPKVENEKEILVPEESEIRINQISFTLHAKPYPKSSIITLGFENPIEPGTYVIKFVFFVREIGEEFFGHWMFDRGLSVEIPVFYECESRDRVMRELRIKQESMVNPENIEFFLATPSNVIAERPQPEIYRYSQYKNSDELVSAFGHEYRPHRGRTQFKWTFGKNGGLVSLRYLKLPVTPIFLFYSVILLDLEIGIYTFQIFDITLRFSLLVFVFWILLLNLFAFSLIEKPSILGMLSRAMVGIGYVNIFWQILGCVSFISFECFIVLVGIEEVLKSPWDQIGIGLFALIYVVFIEFRSKILPEIVGKKLLKLNPSRWEVYEYVAFSWNLFLYSAAITMAAFGFDLLLDLRPELFSSWGSEVALFFSLFGIGAFGGKVAEIIKGRLES